MPKSSTTSARRREQLEEEVLIPYSGGSSAPLSSGLASLDQHNLKELIQLQRDHFLSSEDTRDVEPVGDDDVPPEAPPSSATGAPEPDAFFAASDRWRRPSDYVAHLAQCFEDGKTGPPKKRKKKLARAQAEELKSDVVTGHNSNRDKRSQSQKRKLDAEVRDPMTSRGVKFRGGVMHVQDIGGGGGGGRGRKR